MPVYVKKLDESDEPKQGIELNTWHSVDGIRVSQSIGGRVDGEQFILASEGLQTEG